MTPTTPSKKPSAKPKRVLCGSCGKPIKLDDLGMITKGGFYHGSLPCLMIFLEKEREEKENAKK